MNFTDQDAEALLARPEFLRFLYAAIQSAGVLSQNPHADGQQTRDLSIFEGRRSLGFELLQMAERGQPAPLQSAQALATLNAVIRTELNPGPKGDSHDRRNDRYDDI